MLPLSPSEELILRALWHYPGGGTVSQVRGYLPPSLPYTTLASSLHQLVRKGYARSLKHGRRHWFTACLDREQYGQYQLTQLIVTYFHGSYLAAVAYCIRQGLVTLSQVEAVLPAPTGMGGQYPDFFQ